MFRLLPSFLLTQKKSMDTGDSCSREQLSRERNLLYREMHLSFSFSFRSLQILKLHLDLYLSEVGLGHCFLFRLPVIRRLPFSIQICIYVVVQLLFLFIIAHISRSVFRLLMDELSRAVAQFYPTSAGMNGGFSAPPTPPGHSGFLGLLDVKNQSVNEAEMEQDPGTSSNTGSEKRADEMARLKY